MDWKQHRQQENRVEKGAREFRAGYFPVAFIVFATASPVWGKTDTVRVRDFSFTPSALIIQAGDTVIWKVFQQCCIEHSTTRSASPMNWNSGPLALGDIYQLPFPDTGTFGYFCVPHQGLGMIGSVIVQPRSVPPFLKAFTLSALGLCLLITGLIAAGIRLLK